jgi:thiosulfate/3-mercaptopyruvate sulfurtransferase
MNSKLTLVATLMLAPIAAAPAPADPAPPTTPGAGAPAAGKPASAAPGAATRAAGKPATDAMPLVVSPAWLADHLADPDLVILHVGKPDAYAAKHIPGARQVTLADVAIPMQGDGGLHLELPPADDLRRGLERLGISDRSRIVVYFTDDWVTHATRVVLTLDAAGLGARTALLDGGMSAWQRAGRAVTAAVPPPRAGKLAPFAIRPIVVGATAVLASLGKPGVAVVDARETKHYDGTATGGSHTRQHRTGHIAGALSVPFESLYDEQQQLRSEDELKARFAAAGVKPGDTVIGYCHIGQYATAMLLAARRLGHPVQLYDGSFEDWSLFHPGYPVETAPAKPATPAVAPAAPATSKPAASSAAPGATRKPAASSAAPAATSKPAGKPGKAGKTPEGKP